VLRSVTLHALDNYQVLLVHTPRETEVPFTFFYKGVKILTIWRTGAYKFGCRGSNTTKLCHNGRHGQ